MDVFRCIGERRKRSFNNYVTLDRDPIESDVIIDREGKGMPDVTQEMGSSTRYLYAHDVYTVCTLGGLILQTYAQTRNL